MAAESWPTWMLAAPGILLLLLLLGVALAVRRHARRRRADLLHELMGVLPQRDVAAHLAANRAILRHAQRAARVQAHHHVPARNPFEAMTREHVLWEAEFQRTLIELTDDQLPRFRDSRVFISV